MALFGIGIERRARLDVAVGILQETSPVHLERTKATGAYLWVKRPLSRRHSVVS